MNKIKKLSVGGSAVDGTASEAELKNELGEELNNDGDVQESSNNKSAKKGSKTAEVAKPSKFKAFFSSDSNGDQIGKTGGSEGEENQQALETGGGLNILVCITNGVSGIERDVVSGDRELLWEGVELKEHNDG